MGADAALRALELRLRLRVSQLLVVAADDICERLLAHAAPLRALRAVDDVYLAVFCLDDLDVRLGRAALRGAATSAAFMDSRFHLLQHHFVINYFLVNVQQRIVYTKHGVKVNTENEIL